MNKPIYRLIIVLLSLLAANLVQGESLFDRNQYRAPAEDHRAQTVGDNVVILILEDAEARSQTNKEDDQQLDIDATLGKPDRNDFTNLALALNQANRESNRRQGQFRAQLSAIVEKQDENGMLFIVGRQVIILNGEEQLITLTGWVRPFDINGDNSVISSRLVDARIEFTGYAQGGRPKRGLLEWISDLFGIFL